VVLVAGYPLSFGEKTDVVRGEGEVVMGVMGLICVAGVMAMKEGDA